MSLAIPAARSLKKAELDRDLPLNFAMSMKIPRFVLSLIAIGIVIVLLQYMREVLIPFVIAGLLFYALDPFVDGMQRWRIPRGIGAALMIAIVISSVGGLAYFLQDEAIRVVDQVPESLRRARLELRRNPRPPGMLEKVQEAAKEIENTTAETTGPRTASGATRVQIEQPVFRTSDYLWSGSIGALSIANQAIMILFLTFFMLLSDDLYKRKLVELVGPTLEKKKVTVKILEEMATQIESFLLIQLMTSALVAVATGVTLWWLGLEGAALWGFIAGVLNSIPYYGPLMVTTALAFVAFLQFGTWSMTTAVAGAALLITSLEGYLLTPSLVGRAAEMNKVAVFVGLLFWSWVWGVPGMLLAVPMMMIIKTVCDRVEDLQPVGRFLGS